MARSQLDLRVGAAFTRFQCLRLKPQYPTLFAAESVISYGATLTTTVPPLIVLPQAAASSQRSASSSTAFAN